MLDWEIADWITSVMDCWVYHSCTMAPVSRPFVLQFVAIPPAAAEELLLHP